MRPALLFRRGRYSAGRRKAYRGIRLSRPTLEMPAERQPKGPVEEADRVRRRACPMSHIARRAAPALSASSTGAGHIECEKCGLAPQKNGRQSSAYSITSSASTCIELGTTGVVVVACLAATAEPSP